MKPRPMTVGELRERIAELPDRMAVYAGGRPAWETNVERKTHPDIDSTEDVLVVGSGEDWR